MSPPSLNEQYRRVARECTAANLRRAARAISNVYDERMAASGLRGTQFSLLVAVALAGEMPVTRLSGHLGIDRTTLTRNLGPLIRDGLLAHASGSDRRVRMVRLTPKGHRALERALPLWEAAQRSLVRALGGGRWKGLLQGLAAVTAAATDGD